MPQTIVIASHNEGKVKEIRALLQPLGYEVQSASDVGASEPEETGTTFEANAELKAKHVMAHCGKVCLSDDSGLAVEGLDGAPGIYSARWAGADKNWQTAFDRIKSELEAKGLDAQGAAAYFVCVLCLCHPDGHTETFEGRVHGTLTFPPRGDKGFGYDPIFVPNKHQQTFAELDPIHKHTMSHRANAFTQFLNHLKDAA